MADGKWIADLTPDVTLTEAARQALNARLQVVRAYLPLVFADPPRDPENVHQLRVGTRRAGAALRIFASCLPDKTARKAKQRLRRLRRAAGEARDWDVFALNLLERRADAPPREQSGLDYLLGYAAAQRVTAQAHLLATVGKDGEHFGAFIDQTVDAVRAPEKHGSELAPVARPLIAQLLHELEEKARGDLNDYAHLHQVRIAAKRLRYAMELFAACFADEFKATLYPRVEEMQEILGRANDSHVAAQRLDAIRLQGRAALKTGWKTLQPGVTAYWQFHQRRLPRERRAFLAFWKQWQEDGGPSFRALLSEEGLRLGATR
jgi:CHAD domain-containing protein